VGNNGEFSLARWPEARRCWNWFNAYRDPIANDVGVCERFAGALNAGAKRDGREPSSLGPARWSDSRGGDAVSYRWGRGMGATWALENCDPRDTACVQRNVAASMVWWKNRR